MPVNFTFEDIENDPIFKKFVVKKKGRSVGTLKNYVFTLKLFCSFIGKSPTELHDIHREDLRNRAAEFDMRLTEYLDDYVSYLIEEQEYTYLTIKANIGRILSFLHAFKLRPTPEIEIPKKKVLEDAKYALKVDDIRMAIKHSTTVYQVVFLTQAQTGLSISDVLLLDVEDFVYAVSERGENLSIIEDLTIKEAIHRAKTDNNLIGCFDLRRKKTNGEFYTFAGPEVLKNIALLLESREEELLQIKAPIFLKETSRLAKNDREKLSLEERRLCPNMVKTYVIRMHNGKKIFPKIEVDGKKRNYFRTHKLRKWFSNQLRFKAGFNAEDTKYLMGQKTGDVLEHYIDPNNYAALKANYRKALPSLAVNDNITMEENQEAIEQLKKESEIKDEKIAKLEKKMEEGDKKRDKKIEKLEAMVKAMVEKQTNGE